MIGRRCCISSEAPSADAKKADGARMLALRNPRPPDLRGRVACNHQSPCLKSMLVILETIDLRGRSQDSRRGEAKAAEVGRICRSIFIIILIIFIFLFFIFLFFFIIRGCHRQPLILISFAVYFVRLHVTERYIYIYSASYNILR